MCCALVRHDGMDGAPVPTAAPGAGGRAGEVSVSASDAAVAARLRLLVCTGAHFYEFSIDPRTLGPSGEAVLKAEALVDTNAAEDERAVPSVVPMA